MEVVTLLTIFSLNGYAKARNNKEMLIGSALVAGVPAISDLLLGETERYINLASDTVSSFVTSVIIALIIVSLFWGFGWAVGMIRNTFEDKQ